jgi:hypothetical protein
MHAAVKTSINVMRKMLALLLVSLYIMFSVGVIKATHFCMGREASVKFFSAEAKKCPCSLYAKEKTDCCDDEHELIKIEDEQKVISSISAPLPIWKVERIFTERLLTFTVRSLQPKVWDVPEKSPPAVPIWKANHSYIFYDNESYAA